MKILVTGPRGFVGSHVCKTLRDEPRGCNAGSSADILEMDVRDIYVLHKSVRRRYPYRGNER